MKKTFVFVLSYLVLFALSYAWPLISNVGVLGAMSSTSSSFQGIALGGKFFGSLIIYVLMMLVAWFRGVAIGKKYLPVFPFIAGFFDLVLVFIPFVPTVMNLLAIVMGVIVEKSNHQ